MNEDRTLDDFIEEDPIEKSGFKKTAAGKIPLDWDTENVERLCELRNGKATNYTDIGESEYLVYGSNGPIGSYSEANFDGGLIFGRVGAVGEVERIHNPVWVSDNAIQATVNERSNTDFLYYYLSDKQLSSLATKTAQPLLNQSTIGNVTVASPSLDEQRKIATVLHNVDQAIQKTEEIIEQMDVAQEGLLRTLFGKGGKRRDSEVEMKINCLGPKRFKTPVTWDVTEISSVGKVVTGDTPSTDDGANFGGNLPFVTAETLSQGKYITGSERTISDTGRKEVKPIPKGSVIVSCIGDIGKIAIADREVATNQQINSVVIEGSEYLPEFLYYHLRVLSDYIQSQAGQTTIPIVNKSSFASFELFKPPIEEQKNIAENLSVYDEGKRINSEYLSKLTRLKQGLMQDLLSGTVRTTDTNIQVPDEIAQHG